MASATLPFFHLGTMCHTTAACRMPPNSQSNSDASMPEASDVLRSEGSERSLASLANQSKAEAGAGAGASKAPTGQWLAMAVQTASERSLRPSPATNGELAACLAPSVTPVRHSLGVLAGGYMLLSVISSRSVVFWVSAGHVVCCHTALCLLNSSGVPQQLLQGPWP